MANLSWKNGLSKDTDRAAARAQQLAAINEDWNCSWPLDCQRHYRILPDMQPCVLFKGDDLGKWLA
ncbi:MULTISPECIES: hypothetical protein [unclassified Streptomyces]|uniref:hypothetical protein n=1 Tax=unclassified Streptomyces TaxID=2593676 RepID=UPI00093B9A27|nr:hypothetical protein A6A29_41235 [Streptomyces sp. TSRI0281]